MACCRATLQVENLVCQTRLQRLNDLDAGGAARLEKPAILCRGVGIGIGGIARYTVPAVIATGSVVVVGAADGEKPRFLIQVNRMERRGVYHVVFDEAVLDAEAEVLVLQEIDSALFFPRLDGIIHGIVGCIVARHRPHRASGFRVAGQGDVACCFRLLLQLEFAVVGVVTDEVVAIG